MVAKGGPARKEAVEAVQEKGARRNQEAVKGREEEPAGQGDGWIWGRGEESRTTSRFLASVGLGHLGVPLRIRPASWLSAGPSSQNQPSLCHPSARPSSRPLHQQCHLLGLDLFENMLLDIWGQIIVSWTGESVPGHGGVLSSVPGPHPVDARSTLPQSSTKNVSRRWQVGGEGLTLSKNQRDRLSLLKNARSLGARPGDSWGHPCLYLGFCASPTRPACPESG